MSLGKAAVSLVREFRENGPWGLVQGVGAGLAAPAHWSPGCKACRVLRFYEMHAWGARREGKASMFN